MTVENEGRNDEEEEEEERDDSNLTLTNHAGGIN